MDAILVCIIAQADVCIGLRKCNMFENTHTPSRLQLLNQVDLNPTQLLLVAPRTYFYTLHIGPCLFCSRKPKEILTLCV